MPKRFVRRSWGWYLVLLNRRHFKVKILRFKRGKACSRQRHYWRKELWLFLKGNGVFTLVPDERRENDPCGNFATNKDSIVHVGHLAWHKYEAKSPTLILEIQYGEKCEEEDIVRV